MKCPLILLDSGHGGKDPGAIAGGVREKDLNLSFVFLIAGHLQYFFRELQLSILFTRTRDVYMPASARVKFEHNSRPDLFVSIHCNSAEVTSARGSEILFYSSLGGRIAQRVLEDIRADGFPIHGDGIVRRPNLTVLAKTHAPAILVETLFLSNSEDRKMLTDNTSQDELAKSIAEGIYNSRGFL